MNDDAVTGSIELGGQTYLGDGHTPVAKSRGPLETDEVPETLGPYQILQEIGRGGMGLVLRGRDEALKRDVAIKIIRPSARPNAVQRMRFIKEAQITGQLEHPGIAPVHYLGWDEGGSEFFSMKLFSGQPLDKLLKAWHAGDSKLRHEYPLPRLISIFERVCETVGFAHSRGIIHRDLKPSNVMIGTYGEVWVLDWGLAKVIGSPDEISPLRKNAGDTPLEVGADMTLEGTVMGTPEYMAPEQAAGEDLDEGVDIFGLGALLYEILSGQAPYGGKTIADVVNNAARGKYVPLRRSPSGRNAPRSLAAITEMCMKRRRERRYASVQDLLYDLRAYAAGEPLRALQDTPLDILRRFSRRHGKGVAVAALLLLVVLTTLTVASVTVANKDRIAHEAEARRLAAELDKQKTLTAAAKKDQQRAAAFEPYAKAMDLLLRGQLSEQAATLLKQALTIDPDFPEAQFALGEALRQCGLPGQAADAYLKSDALSRKILGRPNLHALIAAGFAYDGAGFYSEADNVFKRAESEGANDPLALVGRTFSLAHHSRVREAREAATQALKLAPHLWEAHFAVGFTLLECVDEGVLGPEVAPQAIKALRDALDLSPRQAETCAWLGIGLSHMSREAFQEAIAFIDRTIALEPQNGNRYVLRAIFHLMRAETELADQAMAKARKLGISQMQIDLYQYRRTRDTAKPDETFRNMGQLVKSSGEWPSYVSIYLDMGLGLGKQDELKELADRWAKQNPEYASVFAYHTTVKFVKKDWTGAMAEAKAGLKVAPYNATLRLLLARSLFFNKQFSEALPAAESALERASNSFDCRLIKLACLSMLNKRDEARAYQKILESDYPEKTEGIAEFLKNFTPP